MKNFKLLDEIETGDKTLTGIIDFVNTKYVSFYNLSMNADPYIIKVVLLWRSYFSHIRFSVFKALYFENLKIDHPIMINKKTITNGIPSSTPRPKRRIERVLPNDAVIIDFIEKTDDHKSI